MQVGLAVAGARVEALPGGAWLVLEPSGRKIAYGRLRATDATGKELAARIEVIGRDGFHSVPEMNGDAVERVPTRPAVVVDDAEAVYPVRIDSTFSDADWVSLGSGINNTVYALAVSGSELYAAGNVCLFFVTGASPNGTAAPGRPWATGWGGDLGNRSVRWR